MISTPHSKERNLSLDILRVIAIFLVIWQHSSEFYYITPTLHIAKEAAPVVGIINSYARICIGLFVMISGYLLLPMKQTTGQFFRRRFTRVLFPWLFWCVVYAVYITVKNHGGITEVLTDIAHIPVNFATEVGHLWYVYMLLGLYLLVPIISPWLRSCSKRELQFYLVLWGITTLLPYLHLVWPQLWGETYWNPTPTLYYFTGFAGYLVLGHYVRRYGVLSQWLSWLLVIVGYTISAYIFCTYSPNAKDMATAELPWNFCSLNVAMMTLGTFSLVSRLHVSADGWWRRLVVNASVCSYAIYLAHIIVLWGMYNLVNSLSLPIPAKVACLALSTFCITWVAVVGLSNLPKAKWWLGV